MFKVQAFLADPNQWMRNMAFAINQLIDGKSNAVGQVTLRANETTTVVSDLRVGIDSVIPLQPTTANAAAAVATTYISSLGKQTFTITHASNAQTDKTFKYLIQG